MILFYYLPGELIDDLSAFEQNEQSVMTVQNRSVWSSLQRAGLPWLKREFDGISWQSPECFELHRIQNFGGVEEQ